MAGNETLLKAMGMFAEGVQDLQRNRSLDAAMQQVNEIKSSELDESKQRAAVQQVSNELATNLFKFGAQPAAIEQMRSMFAGPQYKTSQEAAIAGSLMGGKQGGALLEAAKQADIAGQSGNMAQLQQQEGIASRLQDKKFAQAKELASMKGRAAPKPGPGDKEFATNVEVGLKEATKLENTIKKFGGFEFMNPEATADLSASSYQLAINYAKIVDPASVAREGEVAAAQKYLIPLGMGTRNSVSLAAVKRYKKTIKEYVMARQKQGTTPPSAETAPTAEPADDISKWLD